MAKLKIYTYPDVVLTQKASPIDRVDKSLHRLADDMLETMYAAPGIGLAANQVGILQRLLVIDTDYDIVDEEEAAPAGEVFGDIVVKNRKPILVFNPEIVYREGSITMEEGCLSVPEYAAEVKRSEKIKIEYQDVDGLKKILSAEGLLAVAIQHEMDHLEGRLFIDRLSTIKKEIVRKKLREERKLRESDDLLDSALRAPVGKKKKGF